MIHTTLSDSRFGTDCLGTTRLRLVAGSDPCDQDVVTNVVAPMFVSRMNEQRSSRRRTPLKLLLISPPEIISLPLFALVRLSFVTFLLQGMDGEEEEEELQQS